MPSPSSFFTLSCLQSLSSSCLHFSRNSSGVPGLYSINEVRKTLPSISVTANLVKAASIEIAPTRYLPNFSERLTGFRPIFGSETFSS